MFLQKKMGGLCLLLTAVVTLQIAHLRPVSCSTMAVTTSESSTSSITSTKAATTTVIATTTPTVTTTVATTATTVQTTTATTVPTNTANSSTSIMTTLQTTSPTTTPVTMMSTMAASTGTDSSTEEITAEVSTMITTITIESTSPSTSVASSPSSTTTIPSTTTSPVATTPTNDPPNVAAIVGGVFGGLIALLLIVIIILLFIWLRKKADKPVIPQFHAPTSKPVEIRRFPEYVQKMAKDQNRLFAEEFEENLKMVGRNYTTDAAKLDFNMAKNRFMNILPYDHSRVRILPSEEEGSDYINANWMPGYTLKREYICTQGPLPNTLNDFWRMVWEHKSSAIVMLTLCTENFKVKCHQYWPLDDEAMYCDDIVVQSKQTKKETNWTITDIAVAKGHRLRNVTHFHYTTWPDMAVPNAEDVLSFIRLVRSHLTANMDGPIIVHCSAGVGRTGSFITVDRVLQQLDEDPQADLDVYGIVSELRNHRCSMVQTEAQYAFVHAAISLVVQRVLYGSVKLKPNNNNHTAVDMEPPPYLENNAYDDSETESENDEYKENEV